MPCTLGVRVAWLVVTARIAMFGDENDALPSHRELNAVRRMLGPDPGASDLSGFDGVWLVPASRTRPTPSPTASMTTT
jgi:hypothetical protein